MRISYPQEKSSEFPVLKGPYLGQKPPGDIPELFECRISPQIEISDIPLFTKSGKSLVFNGSSSSGDGIFITEQKNGIWLKPRKVLSSDQYSYRHLFLTPDEKRLFFTSRRMITINGKKREELKIWIVENTIFDRIQSYKLEFPVNTVGYEFYSTVTCDGTLYFTRASLDEKSDIYRSGLANGNYPKVEKLPEPINTEFVDADPFIAPDESYIIFLSNRPGGLGYHDFFISFQTKDGDWSKPKHLGKNINSKGNDVCPLVTADGRLFFFGSNRTGDYEIYWVDAGFIDRLRPENLK